MATNNEEYFKQRIREMESEGEKHKFSSYEYQTSAAEIKKKIAEIKNARSGIFDAAKEKGNSISNYDRAIALTILKIKNGLITEMADPETGEVVQIPQLPATVIPQIAKGLCWMESGRKEEAEALYRAILSNIEAIKSELNGLQTITKYID